MDWGGRAGEVKDIINLKKDRLGDIVAYQLEVVLANQMCDIFLAPSEEIVQADDLEREF